MGQWLLPAGQICPCWESPGGGAADGSPGTGSGLIYVSPSPLLTDGPPEILAGQDHGDEATSVEQRSFIRHTESHLFGKLNSGGKKSYSL